MTFGTERAILSLLRLSSRRPARFLAASALVGLVAAALVTRLSLDANVLHLLPRGGAALRALELYLERFGTLDRLYLLFEAGPGMPIFDHATFVDAYVERLRQAPEIQSVDASPVEPGKDWSYVFDRALLLLPKDRWPEARDRFRSPGMKSELERSKDMLSLPSPQVKALVQGDPLRLLPLLREQFSSMSAGLTVSPNEEGYVSADGGSRLVLVNPKGPTFDVEFCRRLFARLAEVERGARADEEEASSGVRVEAAGGYRVALEAEALIKREMASDSLMSLAAILVLVLVVVRDLRVLVYAAVPLGLGTLVALAIFVLSGDQLLAGSTGGAAILFGLGIDGVLLLYFRHLEERDRASGRALENLGATAMSVVLGNVTTAVTFLTLLVIDFPSLQELGRLVGTGILFCCAFALVVLPAFFALERRSGRRTVPRTPWLGRFVVRRWRAILAAAAALTLVLGASALQLKVDTRLERLEARTAGTELERELRRRFGIPTDVLLVLAEGDLDGALARHRKLLQSLAPLGASIQVSSPLSLLPPASEQREAALRIRAEALSPDDVAASFRKAAAEVGLRAEAFGGFQERLTRLLDPDERLTYTDMVEHGLGDVLSRFISRNGEDFLVATYLYPEPGTDRKAIERAVAQADSELRLTGVSLVNAELEETFLPRLLTAVGIGTVVVALFIYLDFGRLSTTLAALFPVALGMVWSGGLLAAFRVEVDLFSAFAIVMAIGVGVDYGIHVLRRYSVEGKEFLEDVVTNTGTPILLSGAATLLGFGSLVASSYAPLKSLGIVGTTTLLSCWVCALLVLPALLKWRSRE